MRKGIITGILAAMIFAQAAKADSIEGVITRIDASTNIVRLDDGNNYTMPGEIDYSLIREGMKVLLFYDIGGDNQRYVSFIEADGLDLNAIADEEDEEVSE